jgi:hypothetical protein
MTPKGRLLTLLGLATAAAAVSAPRPCAAAGRAVRVLGEAVAAPFGFAAGAASLGGVVYAVSPGHPFESRCEGLCLSNDDIPVIAGGFVGGVAGLGTTVYGAGRLMDGQGGYWATMGGEGIGLAALGGLLGGYYLCAKYENEPCEDVITPMLVIGVLALPIGGAVVGYEWSSDARGRRSAQASEPLVLSLRYARRF